MRWSFYDEITDINYGSDITAVKVFSKHEEFFYDHFPGFPIVPGVIQIEAIAQIGGRLIAVTKHHEMEDKRLVVPIVAMVKNAVFRGQIGAGDKVTLNAKITEMYDDIAHISGQIKREQELIARISLVFNIIYSDKPLEFDSLYGVSEKSNMVEINDNIWRNMKPEYINFLNRVSKGEQGGGRE